ncbi:alpha-hemoglobin-stabilizing protein-like [Monodelphis domestica]|uniref:Alpha-hemoglobin-stabilizing protein n=1 Tax=Monodelphis domestica TaxID=13616 RepID=F7DP52_MONDO|nr:alpha-hemoglobin-stabilizing protein [Monodelphis domestica]XP_007498033.1 alpha-hemoglobin-stabilizing protein [Monodelphis domestica]XP_007498034.1 alpha-hemoglobin-stabilizing protein [Monodelphis domestica]XP_007498035.1 alpha-hemoglobin-stabilizing protein [Monodelphis domestica]XP_056660807.1 alpha-hemoglobin-stabilizing protein-like [Monodelphis domestica]
MALQSNQDVISSAMQEFNKLLNQQDFTYAVISEKDMVTIVDDWMNYYLSFFSQKMSGDQQEQERAMQKLQEELRSSANPFLDKYRAFLKSL